MNIQKNFLTKGQFLFRLSSLLALTCFLFTQSISAQPYLTYDLQEHIISFNGNDLVQEFRIPTTLSNGYIYLEATGADGGRKRNGSQNAGNGGQGAIMGAWFEIGAGTNKIPPGSEVVFIIGERGQNINNAWVETAGGGGGTGIFYKRPDNQYTLLAVAGGGGGGYSDCCTDSDAGYPAEITRCPFEGHDQFCKIVYLQWYEIGDNCTTGGGLINDIEDYFRADLANGEWDDCGSNDRAGLRGWPGATHYLSNPVKPTGGAGGEGARSGGFTVDSKGGFGVGGGAGGAPGNQRVGGGGFTPGTNGIGAGSFINHIFVGTPTKIKRGNTSNPQHGQIKYQIFPTEPVAVCNDLSVTLDQNGNDTVEAVDAGVGSYDPNGLNLTYRLIDLDDGLPKESLDFDCSNVGQPYETTLLVYNLIDGNIVLADVCSTTVTVKNRLVVNCQNAAVRLDGNGEATLDPSSIDDGSLVSCGGSISSFTLSQNRFTCADIGDQTVTLTAADSNGDTESCTATVSVQDAYLIAKCKDITIDLENNERKPVPAHQVDDNSASLCSGVFDSHNYTRRIEPAWINCNQINTNVPATLTLKHKNGVYASTCTSNIRVIQDLSKAAKCKDLTVTLDQSGQNNLNVELGNIDYNDGSYDYFCKINGVRFSWSQESFTCADVGDTPVTLTLKDAGNDAVIDECISIVSVKDKAGPIAHCKSISIQMPSDPSPTATLWPSDIDNGSYDLCGNIAAQSLWDPGVHPADDKQYTLIIETEGASSAREISWTVTSGGIIYASGDSYSTERTITETFSLSPGGYQLNVYDSYGDALCFGTVCAGFYRLEDDQGNVVILGSNDWDYQDSESFYVTGGTFRDRIDYRCQHLGARQVVLYQEDNYGNGSICQTTVTIEQDLSEAAQCKDVLVTLDQSGQNRLFVERRDNDFNNGSGTSSCLGGLEINWSPNQEYFDFSCSDIGEHPVTLSLTNGGEVIDQCTSIITVSDQAGPVAQCKPITVQLPESGSATLSASELNDGSYDLCGSVSSMQVWDPMQQSFSERSFTLTIQFDAFTRDNSWTVTSGGNTITSSGGTYANETSYQMIAETFSLPPGAYEFNFYDSNGDGFATTWGGGFFRLEDDQGKVLLQGGVDDWDYQKSVNFTVEKSAFSDKLTYDCADIGTRPVVFLVRDAYDNGAICKTTVSVADDIAPTLVVIDPYEIYLDDAGTATLSPRDLDDGSYDNCEYNLSIDKTSFDCSSLGSQEVALIATDPSGNQSSTTVAVHVKSPPSARCKSFPLNVDLNTDGMVSITPDLLDDGSTVICGMATYALDKTDFDCGQTGSHIVTLTVSDDIGQSDECTATVVIQDNTPPTALCKDITVTLDDSGTLTLNPVSLDAGSYDACGLAEFTLTKDQFTCADVGTNLVFMKAIDINGVSSSCQASVLVRENITWELAPGARLWPPDYSYQSFSISDMVAGLSGACSGNMNLDDLWIDRAASDEEEDDPGTQDGNTLNDVVISEDCRSLQVRRERMGGGNGRVYTITLALQNSNGDISYADYKIQIPKWAWGWNSDAVEDAELYAENCGGADNAAVLSGPNRIPNAPANDLVNQIDLNVFPNPFQSNLNISFKALETEEVKLEIFNVHGQRVRLLHNGLAPAGEHQQQWDGAADNGRLIPPGMYLLRLKQGKETLTKKVLFQGM